MNSSKLFIFSLLIVMFSSCQYQSEINGSQVSSQGGPFYYAKLYFDAQNICSTGSIPDYFQYLNDGSVSGITEKSLKIYLDGAIRGARPGFDLTRNIICRDKYGFIVVIKDVQIIGASLYKSKAKIMRKQSLADKYRYGFSNQVYSFVTNYGRSSHKNLQVSRHRKACFRELDEGPAHYCQEVRENQGFGNSFDSAIISSVINYPDRLLTGNCGIDTGFIAEQDYFLDITEAKYFAVDFRYDMSSTGFCAHRVDSVTLRTPIPSTLESIDSTVLKAQLEAQSYLGKLGYVADCRKSYPIIGVTLRAAVPASGISGEIIGYRSLWQYNKTPYCFGARDTIK